MSTVLIVNGEGMGRGDEALGARVQQTLLGKAAGAFPDLSAVVFYNGGVRLLAEGSPALQVLAGLLERGADLIACGTCVDHFGLRERIRVGQVGSMDEILTELSRATKVITL